MKIIKKRKTTYITFESKGELENLLKIIKLINKKPIEEFYVMGEYKGTELCIRLKEKSKGKTYSYVAGNVIRKTRN